jgi:hypothetical protein
MPMNQGISFQSLPDDFQVLILQILESCGVLLKEEQLRSMKLPTRILSANIFPEVPILTADDDRDLTYAEAMVGQNLPPIVICGKQWLDGRHRVWALRKMRVKTVNCIDLESLIGRYPFPQIGTLKLA